MNVPLVDLVAQYHTLKPEIDAAIQDVLEHGQFILGPNVKALEQEVAAYVGVEHGIGVASGTDALILALRALEIGPGDEVIVPAYTFLATAGAVMLVGATPVMVDVEPETLCIDVEATARAITPRTKAIIPVHLYGQSADMQPLLDLARQHDLTLIEDNAQGLGADYHGQKTGQIGPIACLSFFPSKNLGAYGDGGMVLTTSAELAERVRMLRAHGSRRKYHPEMLGYNSRLDEMQAAILRVKLRHLDAWNHARRALAARYAERLAPLGIRVPRERAGGTHIYHVYVLEVERRDEVERELREAGIGTSVYYPLPLHLTELCQPLGYREGDFPVSERASRENLAIPIFPEMTAPQQEMVVAAIKQALQAAETVLAS